MEAPASRPLTSPEFFDNRENSPRVPKLVSAPLGAEDDGRFVALVVRGHVVHADHVTGLQTGVQSVTKYFLKGDYYHQYTFIRVNLSAGEPWIRKKISKKAF